MVAVVISLPVWMVQLGSCEVVSAAVLGSTIRIPVSVPGLPGLPDIIQTTFPISRSSNISSDEDITTSSPISITNEPCTTTCSGTAGAGPNQFDCTTIANSLRAGSEGAKNITLTPFLGTQFAFRSCKIVVTNQDPNASVVSTQRSIAVVAQNLAEACNAAHNAAAGECRYAEVQARIDVQHS
ncbi:hypothetical protein FS749_014392 [Ceratobasidium sp. UAMH 11750]|nr:hypothetical protein FS749_014392 [Ceratobasidium sp. UAMH 11750]